MSAPTTASILFFIRSPGYLRIYESTFRALVVKGYSICVIFDPRELDQKALTFLKGYGSERAWFSFERGFRRSAWKRTLRFTRGLLNYRRFLVVKEQSRFYRNHWLKFISPMVAKLIKVFPPTDRIIASSTFEKLLLWINHHAPIDKAISGQLARLKPRAVVVGFRNQPSSAPDLEYLATAKHLGIPSILPTPSWDMLSSKGLIEVAPDKLLVWNKEHKDQAIRHHHIPKETIVIVGAYQFDDWMDFDEGLLSRAEFAKSIGFDPKRPILLLMGSGATTGDDAGVAKDLRDWLDQAKGEKLKAVQLLIRPAPMNYAAYKGLTLHDSAVVPLEPIPQGTPAFNELLLNSAKHSFAATTLHTTGIIDVMLKGTPGVVIEHERFNSVQLAEHFQELVKSGAVYATKRRSEFENILEELILGHDPKKEMREKYLKESIRPQGFNRNVGEIVASEIVSLIKK